MNEWNDKPANETANTGNVAGVEATTTATANETETPENNEAKSEKAEERRERRLQIKLNALSIAHDKDQPIAAVLDRAGKYYDFLRK